MQFYANIDQGYEIFTGYSYKDSLQIDLFKAQQNDEILRADLDRLIEKKRLLYQWVDKYNWTVAFKSSSTYEAFEEFF